MNIPNNKISERSLILELVQKLVVPPFTTPLLIPLIVIKKRDLFKQFSYISANAGKGESWNQLYRFSENNFPVLVFFHEHGREAGSYFFVVFQIFVCVN